jgi:hypothetical protein
MAVSRRLVLPAVTVAVSLALSFIAAEVTVRALHLAPPTDKDYGNDISDSRVPCKFRPFSVTTGVADVFPAMEWSAVGRCTSRRDIAPRTAMP